MIGLKLVYVLTVLPPSTDTLYPSLRNTNIPQTQTSVPISEGTMERQSKDDATALSFRWISSTPPAAQLREIVTKNKATRFPMPTSLSSLIKFRNDSQSKTLAGGTTSSMPQITPTSLSIQSDEMETKNKATPFPSPKVSFNQKFSLQLLSSPKSQQTVTYSTKHFLTIYSNVTSSSSVVIASHRKAGHPSWIYILSATFGLSATATAILAVYICKTRNYTCYLFRFRRKTYNVEHDSEETSALESSEVSAEILENATADTLAISDVITVRPLDNDVIYKKESLWVLVPSGAVSQQIQIRARFVIDKQSMPLTDTSQNWFILSPVLELEPHGAWFRKPIKIKFPMTAIFQGWYLVLLRADCDASETPKVWKDVLSIDTDTRQTITQDEHCRYYEEKGVLEVNHFCKYCWCGQPKDGGERSEKTLDCLLFAQINNRGKRVNFILHFSDWCHDVYKLMLKTEADKTPAFHLVDRASIRIGLRGDLKIEMSSEDFEIQCNNQDIISASDMWKFQFGPQKRILFSAKLKPSLVDETEDPDLWVKFTTDDQCEQLHASFALAEDQRLMSLPATARSSVSSIDDLSVERFPASAQSSQTSKSSKSSGRGSIADGDIVPIEVHSSHQSATESNKLKFCRPEAQSACESIAPSCLSLSRGITVSGGTLIVGDNNYLLSTTSGCRSLFDQNTFQASDNTEGLPTSNLPAGDHDQS